LGSTLNPSLNVEVRKPPLSLQNCCLSHLMRLLLI